LAGDLDSASFKVHPMFGLYMPTSCEGVPDEILNPRETWSDKKQYDARAGELQNMFQQNAERMRSYGG
jgi:phosphoenolpyruvate carboxykinase (ATP)